MPNQPPRALAGVTVLVTRPTEQSSRLSTALRQEGAQVVELPTIQIEAPLDWAPVDRAIEADRYDWVVFTSANAVRFFADRLTLLGRGASWFAGTRVAAIGPQTAQRLRSTGVSPALVPDEFVAEALVAEMAGFLALTGHRILLPSAELARDTLNLGLRAEGAIVDQVTIYRTVRPEPPAGVLAQLRSGQVHAATFTSSSTVTNLASMLGADTAVLRQMVLACIGPITAETARQIGFEPQIVASTYTIPGLVAAISSYYRQQKQGLLLASRRDVNP